MRSVIARSLSHFQLGESGDGSFLLQQARAQAPDDANYGQALTLFIAEEKEHARLLELLVRRFGGEVIRRHWTHLLFRQARRAFGLNFEIQVLVIAELVGTAYYRLLHLRTRDPVLEEVCALILGDESEHIAFHVEWLAHRHSELLPAERGLWSLQFQILFACAAQVAWVDHRAALEITGGRRREFFREARRECIAFLNGLSGPRRFRSGSTADVKAAAPV
jgi:hypothetical protein